MRVCHVLRYLVLLQVIGVGGGGSNAVNSMQSSNLQGVELWVSNTDAQVLHLLC